MRVATPSATATPYAGLGPDTVLDALDAVGLRGDGRLLQLNSYENRVFQVFLDDGDVVVAKFYRPDRWSDAQILEEHHFAAELAEREIPLAAPLALSPSSNSLHADSLRLIGPTLAEWRTAGDAYRFSVTPRQAGRAPELDDLAVLTWIGRFIGRIHAVGAAGRFEHRLTLDVATFGRAARDWLIEREVVPGDALPAWRAAADAALDVADQAFTQAEPYRRLRLHGDCHPGNILWTQAGPHFVDLDDAVTGPAVQDLWMMLSGEAHEVPRQLDALMSGYEQFMDFDRRELRLIEPLRTVRMIHHSAWIARRWHDPAFPAAFPFFAGSAYWQQQAQQLREQLAGVP